MTGAELLIRAFDAGEEFLCGDGDVGQRDGGGVAVVAVGAIVGCVGFAEVVQQRLAATGQLVFCIADNGIQVLDGDAFFLALFLVDEIVDLGDVGITIKQEAVCGQTVTPGATDLLIIAFDAFRQIKVDDEAHVGFVDAHPEGDGGDNDLHIVADERFLILLSVYIFQSGVIGSGGISTRDQIRGQFIHLFAREAIDDARLILVTFEHVDGLLSWVAFGQDLDEKILAVETGNKFIGCGELERGANVLPHARRGRSSQREANRVRELFSDLNKLTILGAKVMPPLRDAVGLVNGQAIHFKSGEKREDARSEQRLGRDVE